MSSSNRPNNGRWKGYSSQQSSFKTDKEIGKSDNRRSNRSFQQYNDHEDDSDLFGNLEDINADRGDRYNQFDVNEKRFGVKSTYDNDLYTTKLKVDDEFYKINETKAEQIEREISRQDVSSRHIAEERGLKSQQEDIDDDEESMYSTVLSGNSKIKNTSNKNRSNYVPSGNKDIPTRSSPKGIRQRKDSSGYKGLQSGSSSPLLSGSPKTSSPLEKSMNQLNLDYPSPTFSKKQKDDFTHFVQKERDLERKKVTKEFKEYKKENEIQSTSPLQRRSKWKSEETVSVQQKEEIDSTKVEKKEDEKPFKSTLNPDAESFNPTLFLGPETMMPIPYIYDPYYYSNQTSYYPYPMQNTYNSEEYVKKPKEHINKVYSESMEKRIKKNKEGGKNYEGSKAEKDWSSRVRYGKESYEQVYPQPNDYYNQMKGYQGHIMMHPSQGYNVPMMPYGGNVQSYYYQ